VYRWCTASNATVARRQTIALQHNLLRCYRIEANRAAYEYRCTVREFADVPLFPRRCYVQRVGASQTFPGQ
jgi:hypothetical protein